MLKKMNTVFGLKDDDKNDNEDDKFFQMQQTKSENSIVKDMKRGDSLYQ